MKRAKITGAAESDISLKNTSKTELDLFTKPVEQNAILAARDFEFGSDWSLSSNTAIKFTLPESKEFFTDLANAYLKVQLKVYRSDNTELDESDKLKVAPVVGFMDSLFSKIVLTLGHVTVGNEMPNYPQLAYLRNLLNFGEEFKSGALRHTQGYAEEIYVRSDDGGTTFPSWRHSLIAKSRLVTMCTRLQNDFFNCSKLLLPHVPVTIRLDRNDAAFSLLTPPDVPDTYKIVISHCTLFVRKVTVSPQAVSLINHRLASQSAIYPYMRTELRHFLIPLGSSSIKQMNLFTGQLPTRLLFAVAPSISVSGGSFHNNPMVFDAARYKLTYVQFYINGVPTSFYCCLTTIDTYKTKLTAFGSQLRSLCCRVVSGLSLLQLALLLLSNNYTSFNAFTPDFESGDYVMSYIGLLRALRLTNDPQPMCPITYDQFGGPNAIFGTDLSADMSNLAMPSEGNISIEVRFKENLPESLNGIIIAEYRSCVQIDKNGDVTQNDL